MAWATFLVAEVDTPSYRDDGERLNEIAPIRLQIYGTATYKDLLITISKMYDVLEEDYEIPVETSMRMIEQLHSLREKEK